MRNIIKLESVSFDQILNDLQSYKSSLPYYEEIKRNTPASTLQLIDDLIAEFASLLNYKYQTLRRETYLSTASLDSSILNISSMLGYNIQRPTCPLVSLQYNAIPTIELKHGTAVGSLSDGTSLVYFGENRFLEKGDIVQFCVGSFMSIQPSSLEIFLSSLGDYRYKLVPSVASAIDNKFIKVYVNTKLVLLSKDAEDYVVGSSPKASVIRVLTINDMLGLTNARLGTQVYVADNKTYYALINKDYSTIQSWEVILTPANVISEEVAGSALDHSLDMYSTSIFLANRNYYQGLYANLSDLISISWIETDGYRKISTTEQLTMEETYNAMTLYSVDSFGTNGDDLSRIKILAPLYYSTLRRAVTESDHKYILEANEYLKSVEVEKDKGLPEEGTITFNSTAVGKLYQIHLGTLQLIEYTTIAGDTTTPANGIMTIQEKLKYLIESTALATVTINGTTLHIKTADGVYLSGYSTNTNLTYTKTVESIKPACCTINAYYIKHDTTDSPIELTQVEQAFLSMYMLKYKMVGSTIRMIPATKSSYSIKIQVRIKNPSLYDITYQEILKLLSAYELTLNTTFIYGKFLADVAKIEVDPTQSGYPIKPIDFVLPDQTAFDIMPSKSSYIKFTFNKEDMNVISQ